MDLPLVFRIALLVGLGLFVGMIFLASMQSRTSGRPVEDELAAMIRSARDNIAAWRRR